MIHDAQAYLDEFKALQGTQWWANRSESEKEFWERLMFIHYFTELLETSEP